MLTHDVDTTYADSGSDPSVQLHQADHDVIHRHLWLPRRRRPERVFNQQMIWGGQSGHAWTSSGTGATFNLDDTSDFALGTRSMRIQTGGTNAQTYVQKLAMPSFDLTNKTVRLWLKLDNYTAGSDLRVWLGSGGAWANYYNWTWTDGDTNKFYPIGGGWVSITLPRSRASVVGTPAETALTDIRVTVFDNNTSMTVHFGGVAIQPNMNAMFPNGVVSLTFDDAMDDHWIEAKSYMDKYGYAGTCYPIIDQIGAAGGLTLTQMKEMVRQSGWEIGLHAYTAANHNAAGGFTALSAQNQIKDIVQQKEWLIANGFHEPDHFAYPQGIFNEATRDNLAGWVASARTTKGNQRETWPPSDRMKLFQRALASSDTAATITALIDAVKTNKEWLILTFHGIVTSGATGTATTTAIFQTIVDHCNTQAVPVRTVGEVMSATYGVAS